ncbi:Putative prophage CPS-53 integrase [Serratia marcescens]|uniref:tyrosine-type recombinase/integrase n=1 Tax=Serratia marcescens TaxID=615 RepID=UPI00217A74BD|nr:integrase arm-type DNA-binding domain-containing protein [Serratia marcescens]CAI1000337.1 Putative prophage CPS-53 integrase [Serratia marcescens]CAI1005462.1 Putative prophage CPS-53 integrase [Serratia marcescens]
MRLNNLQIRNAKPAPKPYSLSDGLGLSLLVEPNGSKNWRFRYRFAGKPKMISFGVYPAVSLADARSKRDEARRQVAEGQNPSALRKEKKLAQLYGDANTFEAIAKEWHRSKLATWSAGYAAEIMRAFCLDIFPYLGQCSISTIKPLELLTVLRKIEARGALDKMRKVRQRCGEVFRYAIATGRAEYNPAADLSSVLPGPNTTHYPFLTVDELPDFLTALEGYSGSLLGKLATKLLMLTGVRGVELRMAQWQEIDLDNALWEIPLTRMKMRRAHLVPLSTQAVAILNELKAYTGHYRYVFPGRADVNKPMSDACINQLLKRIGYHGRLTGHGFRHMMSTVLHEQDFNTAWIEMQLAHVDKNAIRGTYNHAQYLEKRRDMLQWYADFIAGLARQSHPQ